MLVSASEGVRFESEDRGQTYGWVESVLVRQEYARQGRIARGLLRRYIEKMTGMSRAQVSRLIQSYMATCWVRVTAYRRHRFALRYTRADVERLAQVDEAHETLSGPATRAILKREFEVYGRREFERLASISNGHLYNLRASPRYRERRLNYTRTRPIAVSIGERRKPDPRGEPGYLRIDTVHQGDSPRPRASTAEIVWIPHYAFGSVQNDALYGNGNKRNALKRRIAGTKPHGFPRHLFPSF